MMPMQAFVDPARIALELVALPLRQAACVNCGARGSTYSKSTAQLATYQKVGLHQETLSCLLYASDVLLLVAGYSHNAIGQTVLCIVPMLKDT
jgi:hypothetical protein